MRRKKHIAIVGIQGVPNNYGGFEALVEYLIEFIGEDLNLTVFCSSKIYPTKERTYKSARLEYISLNANGVQSIPYDIISIIKSVRRFDKVLVLGASGGILFPFLKRTHLNKLVLNIGGLDWKRSKWPPLAQRFLKLSEKLAISSSGTIISDNVGIQDYIQGQYGRSSTLIEYGGNNAFSVPIESSDLEKYGFLQSNYAFSVARIQPDNNVELIIEAFTKNGVTEILPLVFVGNWDNSSFGKEIKRRYIDADNIFLLDAIYDQTELNLLRSNCSIYIHGHSAGGTNPSLVEAMYLGLNLLAYNSVFNRHTTEDKAVYFKDSDELAELLKRHSSHTHFEMGKVMSQIAQKRYLWEIIANKYKEVLTKDL